MTIFKGMTLEWALLLLLYVGPFFLAPIIACIGLYLHWRGQKKRK
jgi:hypothetical protein